MTPYTLIIVDMQEHFLNKLSNTNKVISNCQYEIKRAIDNSCAIIFVEYYGYKSTDYHLTNLVKDYNKTYTVKKSHNHGQHVIVDLLKKNPDIPKSFRFCGLNTEFCVYETVFGFLYLTKDENRVELVAPACDSGYNHLAGIKMFKKLEREYNQLEVVRCL